MRRQADEAAKATGEQTKVTKAMAEGARNNAKQMALITKANREHASASDMIQAKLNDIRRISDRNREGVRETRKAVSRLLELASAVEDMSRFLL